MGLGPERAPLNGRHFDVVVIGGGINGVAIARECARAGRRTLLVEQNDFASGTTSRSTRIIHGGLRYLEHGEIGLVRESLRERQRLIAERPHLVRPMQFVLAMPKERRSALEIRLGLWLYRKLAGMKHTAATVSESFERMLDRDRESLNVFTYEDAQCEFPERLVAEWLREAIEAGAWIRNHTAALDITRSHGKVRGIRVRDLLDGSESEVSAPQVINATGPWADRVCAQAGIHTGVPMVGGVRGSHIVLEKFAGAPTSAVYTEGADGRPVFLVPWNGQLLFGTTEVPDHDDPGRTRPSAAEIEYLTYSLNRLWPQAALAAIHYAFAGVRPLPQAKGEEASAVTRRYFLRDHAAEGAKGLISIVGGKLTTAASLARNCARKLGLRVPEPAARVGVSDAQAFGAMLEQFTGDVARIAKIERAAARALVSWNGGDAIRIARNIALEPRLRAPIADSDHVLGEALWAVRQEAAVTLADILLRRVPVALSRNWDEIRTREAAHQIGEALGWDRERTEAEIDRFEAERSAFLIETAVVRRAA